MVYSWNKTMYKGFSPLQPLLSCGLDLVSDSVWGRPGAPSLVLEVTGLSLSGQPPWVGCLSSHAHQLSSAKVCAQTVGSAVILSYQAK